MKRLITLDCAPSSNLKKVASAPSDSKIWSNFFIPLSPIAILFLLPCQKRHSLLLFSGTLAQQENLAPPSKLSVAQSHPLDMFKRKRYSFTCFFQHMRRALISIFAMYTVLGYNTNIRVPHWQVYESACRKMSRRVLVSQLTIRPSIQMSCCSCWLVYKVKFL